MIIKNGSFMAKYILKIIFSALGIPDVNTIDWKRAHISSIVLSGRHGVSLGSLRYDLLTHIRKKADRRNDEQVEEEETETRKGQTRSKAIFVSRNF